MDCKLWILEWFQKNGNYSEDECDLTKNFFEQGIIDSFQFISLLGDIENYFHIHFDNSQFQDRDFSTINGLIKCIEEKITKK